MAYNINVTLLNPKTERVSRNFGVNAGTAEIATYSTSILEVTEITDKFIGTPVVVCDAVTNLGYQPLWSMATGSFLLFGNAESHGDSETGATAGVAVASGVSGGIFNFIAFGLWR